MGSDTAMTFDAQGNCYQPCGVCGAETMLGQLGPLTVPTGIGVTAPYDARPKSPTGSRSGWEPIWKRARIPMSKRVQACPSCRSKI